MPNNIKIDLTNLDDIELYELLLKYRIPNLPLVLGKQKCPRSKRRCY